MIRVNECVPCRNGFICLIDGFSLKNGIFQWDI